MTLDLENKPGTPWRVLSRDGEVTLAVSSNGRVKVQVGDTVAVVPVSIAVALMSDEAKRFLTDPLVAEFLFGPADRAARIRAADKLARDWTAARRREFVALLVSEGLMSEADAWPLARIKFP